MKGYFGWGVPWVAGLVVACSSQSSLSPGTSVVQLRPALTVGTLAGDIQIRLFVPNFPTGRFTINGATFNRVSGEPFTVYQAESGQTISLAGVQQFDLAHPLGSICVVVELIETQQEISRRDARNTNCPPLPSPTPSPGPTPTGSPTPTPSLNPTITATFSPNPIQRGQILNVTFSATIPRGLPAANAFRIAVTDPNNTTRAFNFSAAAAGCTAGATACGGTISTVRVPDDAVLGTYRLRITVFDAGVPERSASAMGTVQVIP